MGGRKAGTPNEATAEVREAIAAFAKANASHIGEWLSEIDDPAKRLELYLRALEYHIPKLGRTEVTGENGGPVRHVFRIEEP